MGYLGFVEPLAIGGEYFVMRNEYMIDDSGPVTDWQIRSSGSFSGCSYYSSNTVLVDNPSSDTSFSFQVEGPVASPTWLRLISGTRYKALPTTDLSFTIVRTALGESTWTLSGLCTSSLKNAYSLYKPDGSSPYKLGDYRRYTHGPPSSGILNYTSPTISWGSTGTIIGKFSKAFIPSPNRPYSDSRLRIYKDSTIKAETSTINLNSDGAMQVWWDEPNNITSFSDVNETGWSVSSWHLYSSVWTKDKEQSFTVTKSAPTFTCSATSTKSGLDGNFIFTYTGSPSEFSVTLVGNGGGQVFSGITPTGSPMSFSQTYTAGTTLTAWSARCIYSGVTFTCGSGTY